MKKTATILAAFALASGIGAFGSATQAHAAGLRDGKCDAGEFCYYYNSDNKGSISDLGDSLANYGNAQPGCYDFKGAGNGEHKCVKNNAASVWNRTTKDITVYFNSDFGGRSQTIKPNERVNLSKELKNNNASHRPGTSNTNPAPPAPPADPQAHGKMSDALYHGGGGKITAGFDGYHHTPGRHEGIDFAKGSNVPIYSLTDGVVTNVTEGGGGLSTIAIYQASSDKTIIYLHSNPGDLKVGQQIKRGDRLGTEDDRGSGGSVHTHVEMRPGRQTHAAKSVGDPNLENPNPTGYWKSQGYEVA